MIITAKTIILKYAFSSKFSKEQVNKMCKKEYLNRKRVTGECCKPFVLEGDGMMCLICSHKLSVQQVVELCNLEIDNLLCKEHKQGVIRSIKKKAVK